MGSGKKKAPQVDPTPAINAQLNSQKMAIDANRDSEMRALQANNQWQQAALAQQEKYTPLNSSSSFGPFGSVSSNYDPNTRTVSSQTTLDPRLQGGLDNYLNKAANFDQDVNNELKATDEPINRMIGTQLGDLFGSLGRGGRTSSRGADFAGNFAQKISRDAVALRQQARDRVFQNNQNYYNMFYTPYSLLAGQNNTSQVNQNAVGAGQGGAGIYQTGGGLGVGTISNAGQFAGNTYLQTGRGLANSYDNAASTNAQLQMQQNSRPGLLQTLGGAALGLGSQALGVYMGRGLK